MTEHDTTDAIVRRTVQQIPTPEHQAGFWQDLEQRLATDATLEPIAQLHVGPGLTRRRSRLLLASAAAVLIVALAVGVTTFADREEQVAVTATPAEPGAASDAAERAALQWLDLLAAGDMRAAWDRLGPGAREMWSTFDAFAASRTAFAEGMALWASAEGRQVGTADLGPQVGASIYVVTITGTRHPEGDREDGALALLVHQVDDGFVVEPFSPTSAGLRFTSPAPDPEPSTVSADEPVTVQPPGDDGRLLFVIERDGEVVDVGRPTPTASYVPPGGWASGRHVVTAVFVEPTGRAMAAAVVFDV